MSTASNSHCPPNPPRKHPRPIPQEFQAHASTSNFRDFGAADAINTPGGSSFSNFFKAVLATAVFRCWHIIVFFTSEAFVVTYVHKKGIHSLAIQSTLVGVLGIVLGFVISYRSSSGLERYNEGRKYWSQVIYSIRMFSRVVWFHIPDEPQGNIKLSPAKSVKEFKARTLVEKKTVLNLLLAFAVSLKHYLRGEEGTHYEDLYHLVKFLPAYELPTGFEIKGLPPKKQGNSSGNKSLPLHTTDQNHKSDKAVSVESAVTEKENVIYLAPAMNPPPYRLFTFWPMSLFARSLQKGKKIRGRRALRDHARHGTEGNVPLEVSLYLSTYIASMQQRGADGSSCRQMFESLGQMIDALTALERILHTPTPNSYSVHLWTMTLVWLAILPFQVLDPLGWLAIPGVALAAFVYCGLIKCSEELENPFGYEQNDLNLDHFTRNIIRKELQALTSLPMPDPLNWAFHPDNDAVFDKNGNAIYLEPSSSLAEHRDVAPPTEWVERGEKDIRAALRRRHSGSFTQSVTTLVPVPIPSAIPPPLPVLPPSPIPAPTSSTSTSPSSVPKSQVLVASQPSSIILKPVEVTPATASKDVSGSSSSNTDPASSSNADPAESSNTDPAESSNIDPAESSNDVASPIAASPPRTEISSTTAPPSNAVSSATTNAASSATNVTSSTIANLSSLTTSNSSTVLTSSTLTMSASESVSNSKQNRMSAFVHVPTHTKTYARSSGYSSNRMSVMGAGALAGASLNLGEYYDVDSSGSG